MKKLRCDLEIFMRWLGGDAVAAAAMIAECDDALARFFRHKAGPQDCEDLKQDAWRRLFERPPETLTHGPRAYLLGIARNVLYQYYHERRGNQWDPLTSSICELDPRLAVRENHEVGDWASRSVLQRLPIDDQVLLEFRYDHELELAELAAIYDIPTGTVKSRLNKAHRRFRELLQAKGR